MGLFSGGGFLGEIGSALGINTSAQQAAIGGVGETIFQGFEEGRDIITGGAEAARGELRPFAQAGLGALPGLQAGATLGGFGQNIGDIFQSGALNPLIAQRQRSAESALGRAGLTRSGAAARSAADIPADLAFQLENLLFGRTAELAGLGQGAAGGIANIFGTESTNIANILQAQAEAQGSTVLAQQQAQAAGQQQTGGLLGGLLGGIFSDIRLKTNIKQIGTIHDLILYEWDWKPGVEDLIDIPLMNTGFIAQEVEKLHPEFVGNSHGLKTINYSGLIKHLEDIWLH